MTKRFIVQGGTRWPVTDTASPAPPGGCVLAQQAVPAPVFPVGTLARVKSLPQTCQRTSNVHAWHCPKGSNKGTLL